MFKRGRVLILGACLALAFFAGTWVSAMPVLTTIPTPSPDDFPMTATAYWAGVTATAQAMDSATASMPFPTQDFLVLTDNANAAPTVNAQSIDPIYVTATYIVGRATQTEAYFKTATANPIDPIYVTATAIIAQATQMEAAYMTATAGGILEMPFPTFAPTLTPAPTLRAVDTETLRASWRADLEQAAGFSHPSFDDITYELMFGCCGPGYSRDDLQSHLAINVERVTYENDDYVALVVHRLHSIFGSQVWIFRLSDGVPSLAFANYQISSMGSLNLYPAFDDNPPVGFGDFNGNGLPDIAIDNDSGGSCGYKNEVLLEIQPDSEVVDIVPDLGASRTNWVDLDNDGVMEIQVNWIASDIPVAMNHCSSYLTRYYAWDGTAYRDVSVSLDESHWPAIGRYFDTLQVQKGCLLPEVPIYWMLLGYEGMGRLEEGWTRAALYLQWEKCSPQTLIERADDMGKFLEWVGNHLQEEQQNQGEKH